MSVIQARSYPVSAMAQSVSPPPPAKDDAKPAAMKSTSPGAAVPGSLQATSGRVTAFLATEPATRTAAPRKHADTSEDKPPPETGPEPDAIRFDEAETYQPAWMS